MGHMHRFSWNFTANIDSLRINIIATRKRLRNRTRLGFRLISSDRRLTFRSGFSLLRLDTTIVIRRDIGIAIINFSSRLSFISRLLLRNRLRRVVFLTIFSVIFRSSRHCYFVRFIFFYKNIIKANIDYVYLFQLHLKLIKQSTSNFQFNIKIIQST